MVSSQVLWVIHLQLWLKIPVYVFSKTTNLITAAKKPQQSPEQVHKTVSRMKETITILTTPVTTYASEIPLWNTEAMYELVITYAGETLLWNIEAIYELVRALCKELERKKLESEKASFQTCCPPIQRVEETLTTKKTSIPNPWFRDMTSIAQAIVTCIDTLTKILALPYNKVSTQRNACFNELSKEIAPLVGLRGLAQLLREEAKERQQLFCEEKQIKHTILLHLTKLHFFYLTIPDLQYGL